MHMSRRVQEGWRSLAERTGLENRHTFAGIVGSNPTPSASSENPGCRKAAGGFCFRAGGSSLPDDRKKKTQARGAGRGFHW